MGTFRPLAIVTSFAIFLPDQDGRHNTPNLPQRLWQKGFPQLKDLRSVISAQRGSAIVLPVF
jgi:hypothetical protein